VSLTETSTSCDNQDCLWKSPGTSQGLSFLNHKKLCPCRPLARQEDRSDDSCMACEGGEDGDMVVDLQPAVVIEKHSSYHLLLEVVPLQKEFAAPLEEEEDCSVGGGGGGEIVGLPSSVEQLSDEPEKIYHDNFHINGPPSDFVLDHQKKREKELSRKRKIRKGRSTKIAFLLNKFGTHMQFSTKDGDLFLECIHEVFMVRGDKTRTIYKSWKSLKDMCIGGLKDITPIVKLDIPYALPNPFPQSDGTGKLLNATRCYYVNIMTRIGDYLLSVMNANFHIVPLLEYGVDGLRQFSSYPSGTLFQSYCELTTKRFGPSFFPLMVGIYSDASHCSTTRSACPLFMNIMNVTGTCYRSVLLGYCPLKLPYTQRELGDIIEENGGTISKESLRCINNLMLRKAMDSYIFRVMEPILQYQHCGLKVRIGKDLDSSVIQNMVPYFSHSMGDSAAQHGIAGVSPMAMCSPCRCCMTFDCSVISKKQLIVPRNQDMMAHLSTHLEALQITRTIKGLKGSITRRLTITEKKMQRQGKECNVLPGRMKLPQLHMHVPKDFNNFYMALSVDLLHTLLKGMLEYIASWVLQIVLAISKSKNHMFTLFKGCAKRLDALMSAFPRFHALFPVKWHRFPKGATSFMKSEALKGGKPGAGVGMFSGGFPAWHFPTMLFQMLCCFGCGGVGSILPNTKCVETDHGVTYNPHAIIVEVIISALDVHFLCSAKVLSSSDLDQLGKLIDAANVNVVQLFDMKQVVLRMCDVLKTSKKNPGLIECSRNIKQHLLTHIPAQMERLGVDSKSWDTQIGEHDLQQTVKVAFKKCSKVLATTELEMLKHAMENSFSECLLEMQERVVSNRINKVVQSKLVDAVGFGSGDAAGDAVGFGPGEELSKDRLSFVRSMNMGASELKSLPTSARIGINISDDQCALSPFIHPLLTFKEMYHLLLRKSCVDSGFKTWFDIFFGEKQRDFSASLNAVHGVYCSGHAATGIKEFFVRACLACTRNKHNFDNVRVPEHTFSFLEVKYTVDQGETTFVKIFAILECCSQASSNHALGRRVLFACVARLVKCPIASNYFPFNKYIFEVDASGRLSLDLLPLSCIFRPAFMISTDLTVSRIETTSDYKARSWFNFPFSRCVKTVNAPYNSYFSGNIPGGDHNIFSTTEELENVVKKLQSSASKPGSDYSEISDEFFGQLTTEEEKATNEDDDNLDFS